MNDDLILSEEQLDMMEDRRLMSEFSKVILNDLCKDRVMEKGPMDTLVDAIS